MVSGSLSEGIEGSEGFSLVIFDIILMISLIVRWLHLHTPTWYTVPPTTMSRMREIKMGLVQVDEVWDVLFSRLIHEVISAKQCQKIHKECCIFSFLFLSFPFKCRNPCPRLKLGKQASYYTLTKLDPYPRNFSLRVDNLAFSPVQNTMKAFVDLLKGIAWLLTVNRC